MANPYPFDPATITAGLHVYDPDGVKIGTITDIDPPDFLVINQGLFAKDLYLPLIAVGAVDHDAVYLAFRREELLGRGWGMPATQQAMSSGTAAAMQFRPPLEDVRRMMLERGQHEDGETGRPLPPQDPATDHGAPGPSSR